MVLLPPGKSHPRSNLVQFRSSWEGCSSGSLSVLASELRLCHPAEAADSKLGPSASHLSTHFLTVVGGSVRGAAFLESVSFFWRLASSEFSDWAPSSSAWILYCQGRSSFRSAITAYRFNHR